MPETWLHTNRRALWFAVVVFAAVTLAGLAIVVTSIVRELHGIALALGIGVSLVGFFLTLNLLYWMRVPRLAYENGELLVYLRGPSPIRLPIDVVEVFFLGQGSSTLPRQGGRETETSNVVVRLAEAEPRWKQLDVDRRLGRWCESYITLYGAWCEQLTEKQMAQLNQRLIAAHREQKQRKESAGVV